MGAIKFFNGGQSVTEVTWFSLAKLGTVQTGYSPSVLPTKVFTNKELTTEDTVNTLPCFSTTSSFSPYAVARFMFNSANNYLLVGSSNATHDKTLGTFDNSVASIVVDTETTVNGVKTISLRLTNSGSETVIVKSIQKSGKYTFVNPSSMTSSTYEKWYLDWAYYLDESEWITLAAGETKAITLTITMADLTA